LRIVAYYCLSNATFHRADLASAKARSGLPSEVPAILVGKLGVDHRYQGRGLGRFMLRDAMGRALAVSEQSGVVVMHLHANTDAARDYYLHLGLGFKVSRSEPRTLYLPLATITQALLPE
jgi:GNAT superfamily N-acetyltransferase